MFSGETPLEPRYVVCHCDHCRKGIEFDVVQLAGRAICPAPCPHCGQVTNLQEPAPTQDPGVDRGAKLSHEASPAAVREGGIANVEPPPWITEAAQQPPAADPVLEVPKALTISLPPDPPPPTPTRAPMDVRWLTDLGVVYFRQHQFGEAFLCFNRAAQQGFATAQFCLAVCYLNGQGTTQDEAAAFPWLQQAAAKGNANAEFTLGLAYQLGRGVAPDPLLAKQWLQQAAAHGHPEAIARITEPDVGSQPADTIASSEPAPTAPPSAPIKPAEPGRAVETNPGQPGRQLQRLVLRGEHEKTPEGWRKPRGWRE